MDYYSNAGLYSTQALGHTGVKECWAGFEELTAVQEVHSLFLDATAQQRLLSTMQGFGACKATCSLHASLHGKQGVLVFQIRAAHCLLVSVLCGWLRAAKPAHVQHVCAAVQHAVLSLTELIQGVTNRPDAGLIQGICGWPACVPCVCAVCV